MCILVASRAHPDYELVVLDNRDEFMDRPTADPHWWPNEDIFGPQDLARSEKGTWIGITHTGRVAVLLNVHEGTADKIKGPVSRGILPKLFLESELSPKAWREQVEANSDFSSCGGFTLMIAVVDPADQIVEIEFVSNRDTNFGPLDPHSTVSVSNGAVDDASWLKTRRAVALISPLLKQRNHEQFVSEAISLLSTTTPPAPTEVVQLRRHIFVPRIELDSTAYGTRTQTVLTIDHKGHVEFISVDTTTKKKLTEAFYINGNANKVE